MKRTLLASVAVVAMATAAQAGSLADPIVDPAPVVIAPVASSFEGFYVGATVGLGSGTVDFIPAPPTSPITDALGYGAFAGYNFQSGNMVYGVDVMAQMGEFTTFGVQFDLDYLIDLRARVGYAMGDAMVYAAGGYSMLSGTSTLPVGLLAEADGWNIGAGIEVNVTDAFFVRGEYIYRDLTGSWGPVLPGTPVDVNANSIQIGIGMRF